MAPVEKEGGDITYRDMVDEHDRLGESEIQKFFTGATVLITGGTGFLGKLLIEKLLRSCPDVKKIYMLARPKKNNDIASRLELQFNDVMYDKLRSINPDFTSKITAIPGDVGHDHLGVSSDDRKRLIDEVDVIFHGAATVRFDEPLKTAVEINVKGTRDMFILARACTHLRAFVHTSTAYSNCPRMQIGEQFYTSPVPADKLIDMAGSFEDGVLEKLTTGLLGEYPNTYAFSKAVAESVVNEYSRGLPVAMIRPSIVISTFKEPISGWIDNIYGPTGVVVASAVGLMHTLHCDPEIIADLVPGDMVINATIAAAFQVARDFRGNQENSPSDQPPIIYNYVSSEQQPITWKTFMHLNAELAKISATVKSIWHFLLILTPSSFFYYLYSALMHWFPAYMVDGVAIIIGKKPMLVSAYTKIHKFSKVIAYFSTRQWKFSNRNTQRLFSQLCPADQHTFNFDIATIDWNSDYFHKYLLGLRVYILKDPLDTLPEGNRRYLKLKILHYICVTIFGLLFLRILWAVFVFVVKFFEWVM